MTRHTSTPRDACDVCLSPWPCHPPCSNSPRSANYDFDCFSLADHLDICHRAGLLPYGEVKVNPDILKRAALAVMRGWAGIKTPGDSSAIAALKAAVTPEVVKPQPRASKIEPQQPPHEFEGDAPGPSPPAGESAALVVELIPEAWQVLAKLSPRQQRQAEELLALLTEEELTRAEDDMIEHGPERLKAILAKQPLSAAAAALPEEPPNEPAERGGLPPPDIANLPRWIGYKLVCEEDDPKAKKQPHSPKTGKAIGATEEYQREFATFSEAKRGARRYGLDGVSLVLGGGIVGIDIDHATVTTIVDGNPVEDLHPEVKNWLRFFSHTYVELSPSLTGIHVLCHGKLPKAISAELPNAPGVRVELWDKDRHLTFTGYRLGGEWRVSEAQIVIDKLLDHLKLPPAPAERPKYGALIPEEIRDIHAANVKALNDARPGERNTRLNAACWFAARAFAAKTLDADEGAVKQEIWKAAEHAWEGSVPPGDVNTARHAWEDGLGQPLQVLAIPDDPRQITTPEQAFAFCQKRYFVVENLGGKCRVCWLAPDQNPRFKGRLVLGHQSHEEFVKRFPPTVQMGEKKVPAGRLWLASGYRRQYESVTFAPGQDLGPRVVNLWRGFAVEPREGDCSLYLDLIREVACAGNRDYYEWLMSELAYWVQHPGEQGHIAVVLRGLQGVGKSFLVDHFGYLWGGHYLTLTHPEHVAGRFNAHLRDCSVLFANEALFAGNPQHESILKGIITDSTLSIEQKFVDRTEMPNYAHVFIAGNADWLIRVTGDARRFFMLDFSDAHRGDHNYFANIHAQMESGGYEALLHNLLNRNLNGFNPRVAPRTSALHDQMAHSLKDAEPAGAAWYECLYSGRLPGYKLLPDGSVKLQSETFIRWAKQRGWRITDENLGFLFGEHKRGQRRGMEFTKDREQNANRARFWLIPPLAEARRRWDQHRFARPWPTIKGQQDLQGESWELLPLSGEY
jgi:hypothetical protein